MFRMCIYMHSRFVENHPTRILEDEPLIFEVVLSQSGGDVTDDDGGSSMRRLWS
jgi:hypothetical protein